MGFQEYVCHKRVKAAKIVAVHISFQEVMLEGGEPVQCHLAMFTRYKPVGGDYLVEYEDGYRSFSPAKAFEEGYTLVET